MDDYWEAQEQLLALSQWPPNRGKTRGFDEPYRRVPAPDCKRNTFLALTCTTATAGRRATKIAGIFALRHNQLTKHETNLVQDSMNKSNMAPTPLHCIGLCHDHLDLRRCPHPRETAENVGRAVLLSGRCRPFRPCSSLARGLVCRFFFSQPAP